MEYCIRNGSIFAYTIFLFEQFIFGLGNLILFFGTLFILCLNITDSRNLCRIVQRIRDDLREVLRHTVVRHNQCVSNIPRAVSQKFNLKVDLSCVQIMPQKGDTGSGIAFSERMDAPKFQQKFRNCSADIIFRLPVQTFVAAQKFFEFSFNFLMIGVFGRAARQNTFALIEILVPEFSGPFIEIAKEIVVNRLQMLDTTRSSHTMKNSSGRTNIPAASVARNTMDTATILIR